MKKVSAIGHFGYGHNFLDGQTVKTKTVTAELTRRFGKNQILTIDTYGGAKNLIKAPFQVLNALKNSRNVLIFPAQNSLRVYAPLLAVLKGLFNDRKLHYAVIGGWLPRFLENRKRLAKILKEFDGIYVETQTMKSALEKQGFENVHIMPNCKNLKILSEEELVYPAGMPYKLCTFSRVMREKGIEDAVSAVIAVNAELGIQAFSLDVYGQVDNGQTVWFDELQKKFPPYIRYAGSVDANQSTEVLKNYFALLFPTRFYTEGIPGTVIDAYAAGVPVISAKWESFADIIEDGVTGIGYVFDDPAGLKSILADAADDPARLVSMKTSCLKKSDCYVPHTAVKLLIDRMY